MNDGDGYESDASRSQTTGCLTVLFWMCLAGCVCGFAMALANGIAE